MLQQAQLVVGYSVAAPPRQGRQEVSVALVELTIIIMHPVEVSSARHLSLLLELAILEAVVCLGVEVQEGALAR